MLHQLCSRRPEVGVELKHLFQDLYKLRIRVFEDLLQALLLFAPIHFVDIVDTIF